MTQPARSTIVASHLEAFRTELAGASTPAGIEDVRRKHAGKKSPLKEALRGLRDLSPEERVALATEVNGALALVEAELDAASERIEADTLARQLQSEWQDLSMPGLVPQRGARHPISIVEQECMAVMRQLGFVVVEGPEVEHPWYNFDALNIPEHHPARDAQDTFWVQGGWLLRSHTTTVQARLLETSSAPEGRQLPIRACTFGRVYRNEAVDATHTAMFHQFEGIWVDRGLTFGHLKGTLAFVARALFGEDRAVRFKPKFYPYTEPSVGVDVSCTVCGGSGRIQGAPCEACHAAGWVTILGAGMIHPTVFRTFGFDPDDVSGIAFGLGITRMAAQRAGVTKSASLYEQDLRVHRAVHRGAENGR